MTTPTTLKPFTISILSLALSLAASLAEALPEAQITSRAGSFVPQLLAREANVEVVRATLSRTGIPVLDQLWDSRLDIGWSARAVTPRACASNEDMCRVLSIFRGRTNTHPIVLLPGFTGYRKMYLEQIHDLLAAGYGPVYIPDFLGSGESYRQEAGPGQRLRTAGELSTQFSPNNDIVAAGIRRVLGTNADITHARNAVASIPVGAGYITDFSLYTHDVEFVMQLAMRQNPARKIVVVSLSMSGLVILEAIAAQNEHPTWLPHVSRVVLQSPMIHTITSDMGLPRGNDSVALAIAGVQAALQPTVTVQTGDALAGLVSRALGGYDPNNTISHSVNRLTMTDTMRLWNGYDTLGSTWKWAAEELAHQYTEDPKNILFNEKSLNKKTARIKSALARHRVGLVTVVSEVDTLVSTPSTRNFLRDLARAGLRNSSICSFQTAKHVIDQESDRYREPYMGLLVDLKSGVLRSRYGTAPRHEVLGCARVSADL